jgi:pilus assembly protein CpaE
MHTSGLAVLAAPDAYSPVPLVESGAEKVLRILRDDFAYVVVDAGSSFGRVQEAIFESADTVYLITQVNIPALRNAHRLISHFSNSTRSLEVVLNRFDARLGDIDEASIAKALMQPAKWKIPNDYAGVRKAQNTGVPIAMEDTAVSRALHDMARAACGKVSGSVRKKRFGLFG